VENAIAPICDSGLDPKKRSGQVYGVGEYFGVNSGVSHGYCRNSRMMLVCYILDKGSWFKEVPGFCYVVNNPIDNSMFYCVPVLVVSFGEPLVLPSFISTPDVSDEKLDLKESKPWKSPFRWSWRTDSGAFEPYPDKLNTQLEFGYDVCRRNGCLAAGLRLDNIVRYIDDVPATYDFNFETMYQKNANTGYTRKIQREPVSLDDSDEVWAFFDDEKGAWIDYDSLTQGQILKCYRDYCTGISTGIASIRTPGRPETYRLDFIEGTQTNLTTQKVRKITRKSKGIDNAPAKDASEGCRTQ
jgi:hypothetical protein